MKTLYHGTALYNAYRIFNEGFRLLNYYGRSGVKGPGIYLTDDKNYCYNMASSKSGSYVTNQTNHPCFIQCEISVSKPILWVYEKYDKKVISYLKKEFCKKIDDPDYDIFRFIPTNKHLTKTELINLVNYWSEKEHKLRIKSNKAKNPWKTYKIKGNSSFLTNTRKLLARHGYAGWGQYTHDEWDSDEVVIFNPSEVIPKKCLSVTADWDAKEVEFNNVKIGKEISLEKMKKAYELHEEQIVSTDPEYGDEDLRELYR